MVSRHGGRFFVMEQISVFDILFRHVFKLYKAGPDLWTNNGYIALAESKGWNSIHIYRKIKKKQKSFWK